tara:strand:+ start:127 stop:315 length:189 start_codon:yes stop_codon:yes gene_type:complete
MYTQNDLNIIKTQANSFVNDQLKWQRLRIESLQKELSKEKQKTKKLEELLAYADKFNLTNTQ